MLLAMYSEAFNQNILEATLREALMVLILKPNKEPRYCESYRPISLINVDIKILAKVLARRLNAVISKIIHLDQTGFIPGRSTAINLRRLFAHLQISLDPPDTRIVSLDTHIPFDYIEWTYLFVVLERLWFSPKCIRRVKLLYVHPVV